MDEKQKIIFPFFENGITQVGWIVEDLDKAVEKFHRNTGIGPWHFYNYGPDILKTMKRKGVDTEYNMATAVANAGPLRLEYIQPLSGDMVYEAHISAYGFGGVQHFGIAVDNMEESLSIVRRAGIEVVMEGAGYGLDGDGYFAYLNTIEMFGITIELMERPQKRHKPLKIFPNPD